MAEWSKAGSGRSPVLWALVHISLLTAAIHIYVLLQIACLCAMENLYGDFGYQISLLKNYRLRRR